MGEGEIKGGWSKLQVKWYQGWYERWNSMWKCVIGQLKSKLISFVLICSNHHQLWIMTVHFGPRPSIFELPNSPWTVLFRSNYNSFLHIYDVDSTCILTGDLPLSQLPLWRTVHFENVSYINFLLSDFHLKWFLNGNKRLSWWVEIGFSLWRPGSQTVRGSSVRTTGKSMIKMIQKIRNIQRFIELELNQ